MGPIDILYCWEALLCAATCTGMTQLVKTIIDVATGNAAEAATPTVKDMVKVGKALRQRNIIVNRFVLPMTPIAVGALYALLVPARPAAILEYVAEHNIGWTAYLVYAAWGASCGQFADYIWTKVKDLVQARASTLGDL